MRTFLVKIVEPEENVEAHGPARPPFFVEAGSWWHARLLGGKELSLPPHDPRFMVAEVTVKTVRRFKEAAMLEKRKPARKGG